MSAARSKPPSMDPLARMILDTVRAKTEGAEDLSMRQLGVLAALELEEPRTVRGLSDALSISKPAVTRALDRLTAMQFCQRREDPEDRRSVLCTLLPGGREYMATLRRRLRG